MKNPSSIFSNQKALMVIAFMIVALLGFGLSYVMTRSYADPVGASCEGTCVSLEGDKANPSAITVTNGSYVQFNSADGKAHSLSLGAGGHEHSHQGTFNSGTFEADEAWRVQFNDDGTYIFHDHFNPKINVVVVVYTPGKDYKVQ